MTPDTAFSLGHLRITNSIVIDRPRESSHPRSPTLIYPLVYGYLEHTASSDSGGIDVWLGSLNPVMKNESAKTLTGILCAFDTLDHDAEIKLLIGCTEEDIQIIREFPREMCTHYIPNSTADNDLPS